MDGPDEQSQGRQGQREADGNQEVQDFETHDRPSVRGGPGRRSHPGIEKRYPTGSSWPMSNITLGEPGNPDGAPAENRGNAIDA
jgi:hypothetical protein